MTHLKKYDVCPALIPNHLLSYLYANVFFDFTEIIIYTVENNTVKLTFAVSTNFSLQIEEWLHETAANDKALASYHSLWLILKYLQIFG